MQGPRNVISESPCKLKLIERKKYETLSSEHPLRAGPVRAFVAAAGAGGVGRGGFTGKGRKVIEAEGATTTSTLAGSRLGELAARQLCPPSGAWRLLAYVASSQHHVVAAGAGEP